MTKPELIDELASKTGVSKKDCANVIDAFQDIVKETLIKGDKLQLVGFGTFEVAERKVVMWVGTQTNPNTLIIKALSRTDLNGNKFKNMAVLGDDGSLDIDPNKFKIHALVGGSDGGIFVNGLNTFNPMICVGGNDGGLFPGGDWSFDVYKILDRKSVV